MRCPTARKCCADCWPGICGSGSTGLESGCTSPVPTPPSFGVARIGPVYTPPAQRGRGWASNAVAEVSRRIQADGARVCLYTDQANLTSNKIYAALGYRPVVDMANLVIVR
uniref:GNAT family N-acetyltransferase n=1 Tax=Micromonospora chokoriensis TaxID=356851 RepID=UPI001E2870B0|nr:GNAT family N-acetyltransferase [Micromonospora chokoriensis]